MCSNRVNRILSFDHGFDAVRAAAAVVRGRRVATHVGAMVSPGSTLIKHRAEAEGLDRIFVEAGFEWRESGCSMCLGMNPDRVGSGKRCASTSNRNFEGRQGRARGRAAVPRLRGRVHALPVPALEARHPREQPHRAQEPDPPLLVSAPQARRAPGPWSKAAPVRGAFSNEQLCHCINITLSTIYYLIPTQAKRNLSSRSGIGGVLSAT